jgi:protein tyrosine phosphatase (PTP) superfamily phosphohydrolase (DUF442 family)
MAQDYTPVKVDAPVVTEGQNCWRVGDFYITAQPTDPQGLQAANQLGVVSIICLRDSAEGPNPPYLPFDPQEDIAATKLGMAFVNVPFPHAPFFSQEQFDLRAGVVLDALGSLPRPLLMHCSSGDRASALWAAHLIRDCGLTNAQAIAYAEQSGLAVFKPYVENYTPAKD